MASLPSFNPNAPSFGAVEDLRQQVDAQRLRARLDLQDDHRRQRDRERRRHLDGASATMRPRRSRSAASRSRTIIRRSAASTCPRSSSTRRTSAPRGSPTSSGRSAPPPSSASSASMRRPISSCGAKGRPLWPKFWARTTTMTVAYGHGIAVTPLHLASAYAALVNGGIWRPATLLKRDAGAGARRPARDLRGDQRADAPADAAGRAEGHRPQGRCAGLPRRRQDRHRGKAAGRRLRAQRAASRPSPACSRWTIRAMSIIAMLDEPKGTADTFGYATAGMDRRRR